LVQTLNKGDVEKPITTGLHDLNKVVGGWRRGEFTVIAARPSMGKSAFAASTMVSIGMSGHGILMFSLEMTQAALAARCLSEQVYNSQTPIRYADILNNRIQDWDKQRLEDAAENFADVPIEIDDQAGLTVSEIASRARKYAARLEKQGRRLDVVMVDHLGKVKASKRYSGNIVAETGEVSAALAGLAKELGVAMIALHQLNRGVEGREDKHPTLPDLRNSGDIEQDADTIGFLYRPAYYLERSKIDDAELDATRLRTLERRKHELEIIIAKNRNGPCTTIDLFIDVASNLIRDKA
jgi:replicative DNA helicase